MWALAQSLGQNNTGRDYRAHRGSMQRVSGTVCRLVGPLRIWSACPACAPREPAKSAPEGCLWDADLDGGGLIQSLGRNDTSLDYLAIQRLRDVHCRCPAVGIALGFG